MKPIIFYLNPTVRQCTPKNTQNTILGDLLHNFKINLVKYSQVVMVVPGAFYIKW